MRAATLRAVGLRGRRSGVQLAWQGGLLVRVTPRRGRGGHERHAAREPQLQRGRAVRRGQLRPGRAHVAGAVPDNGAGSVPDYGAGAVPGARAPAEPDRAGGRAGRARYPRARIKRAEQAQALTLVADNGDLVLCTHYQTYTKRFLTCKAFLQSNIVCV